MPDPSNMCINVMTTPWSRVRHWSAPERLQHWTPAEADPATPATTANSILRHSQSSGCLFQDSESTKASSPLAISLSTKCVTNSLDDDIFGSHIRRDRLSWLIGGKAILSAEDENEIRQLSFHDEGNVMSSIDDDPVDHEEESDDLNVMMTPAEMQQRCLRLWSSVTSTTAARPVMEEVTVEKTACKATKVVSQTKSSFDVLPLSNKTPSINERHNLRSKSQETDKVKLPPSETDPGQQLDTKLKSCCRYQGGIIQDRLPPYVSLENNQIKMKNAESAPHVPDSTVFARPAVVNRRQSNSSSSGFWSLLMQRISTNLKTLTCVSDRLLSSVSTTAATITTATSTSITRSASASTASASAPSVSREPRHPIRTGYPANSHIDLIHKPQLASRDRMSTKPSSIFSILICTLLLSLTPASARICDTVIIHNLSVMEASLRGCTVIEGHLAFNTLYSPPMPSNQTISFPELREITEFLVLYYGEHIRSLGSLFPNLSVIRGNRLIKDYALIIREMKGMEEIGLTSLTHILRGAVRIEKNTDLCYVDTIDWNKIVTPKYQSLIHIRLNEFGNKNCMNICPGCKNCWNEKSCQTLIGPCPNGAPKNLVCYHNGTSENGQLKYQCNSECLGGCHGPQQDSCFSCANAKITGPDNSCAKKCPYPSLLYNNWRCISLKECNNLTYSNNDVTIGTKYPYKAYDGKCLEGCPEETIEKKQSDGSWVCEKCASCPKECKGADITSLEDMHRFKGCTIINGDLVIRIRGENVVEELKRAFHKVRIITGSLKIVRSMPIVSLDFFQSLEEIHGIHVVDSKDKKHYSIILMENENLQKLFPVRPDGRHVRIYTQNGYEGTRMPGRAFIHYNTKLCGKEIKALLVDSKLEDPGVNSAEISYATNGDKAVCSETKLSVNITFPPDIDRKTKARFKLLQMTVTFDNYQAEIIKINPTNNYRALLGYEIHYRPIDKATYDARNLTKYGGRDACGDDEWQIIDHPPSEQQKDDNGSPVWPQETEFIMVRPYTHYALFVSTLIVKEITGGAGVDGAQSDIVYVLSPEFEPSPPVNIQFAKLNYSTVNISWSEPIAPNGIIDHYEVVLRLKTLNFARTRQLDSCDATYRQRQIQIPPVETLPKPPETNTSQSATGQCDCTATCPSSSKPSKKREFDSIDKKLTDDSLVDAIVDYMFPQTSSTGDIPDPPLPEDLEASLSRTRRAVADKDLENQLEGFSGKGINTSDYHNNKTQSFQLSMMQQQFPPSEKTEGTPEKDPIYRIYSTNVSGNSHYTVVTDLQHDSSYTVELRACHKPGKDGFKRCSQEAVIEDRTLVKPDADRIPGKLEQVFDHPNVDSDGNGKNETLKVAVITWKPPVNPNTLIVSYNIRLTRDDDVLLTLCITAKNFEEENFRYTLKVPGVYLVQVQAVPINAEPGPWTEPLRVSVAVDDQQSIILMSVLIPVSIIIVAAIAGFSYYYIKQKQPSAMLLNPNYHQIETFFTRDEYWICRDSVTVGELIGSGAFGEVHRGVYHHPQQGDVQVAIKMLRETAVWNDRKLFLEEANIMKNLRSAHIVELIGAVPDGLPSYILLEIMPNGDLKKYLRDSRPKELNRQSVRPPPTERELLQFALEIADGMAFLTCPSRSIVHRDLAARNCLLTADNVVKVGDFGRARDVYESEYYRQTFRGMVPVRWTAPESLRDGEYVSKSDVWSYGVVLWEMATLAEEPYQGMPHDQVVNYIVNEGGKPDIRPHFPDSLVQIMEKCWRRYPDDRPSFLEIIQMLERYANDRFRSTAWFYTAEAQSYLNVTDNGDDDLHMVDMHERIPLRESSSSGYGNGNTGNSNGDARSSSAIDNGHAVMMAAAASELGSTTAAGSHITAGGEVRQLGHSAGSVISYRNPSSSSSSSQLSNIRNLWLRFRHGGRVIRGPHETSAEA